MITVAAYGGSRAVLERTGTMNDGGIRRAGMAAMLGGAIFGANILSYTLLGLDAVYESSVLAASLNDGTLLVAWGLMLWGLLGLRSYGMGREYGRLWTAGIALTGIGLALCTIGFVFETFAPLAGLTTLGEMGGMTIGVGLLTFVPVGAVVLGAALLRTGAIGRVGAVFMIAAGPTTLTAMFAGEALPPLVGAALFGAVLGTAWIAVGYGLRTASIDPITAPEPEAAA